MDGLTQLLRGVWLVGLPVAALTFGLVWWALRGGMVGERNNMKSLQAEIDALAKRQKGKTVDDAGQAVKPVKLNPVHAKWFKFGGGFYGVTALYTWLLIEWSDVLDFLGGLGDLFFRLDVSVLINFFVESLMNFIAAIAWPLYWMETFGSARIWVVFLVAWAGYSAGVFLAQRVTGLKWDPLQRFFKNDEEGSP